MSERVERQARQLLGKAKALRVPTLVAVPEVVALTPLEFAAAAGIVPDEWQRRALESTARKQLFCCSRQSGKSLTADVFAGHEAVTNPGALVLMLAPSMRQSGELFRTCLALLKRLDVAVPDVVMESTLRVELANGSRIIALPGAEATVRGYGAASMVILDEAARVPDALIAAARPSLAVTNGKLIALSTPAGRRGWFFLEWTAGENWERSSVTAAECPRISAEFLLDEMHALGPRVFDQEYNCQFYDPDSAAFASELIDAAFSDELVPLWS